MKNNKHSLTLASLIAALTATYEQFPIRVMLDQAGHPFEPRKGFVVDLPGQKLGITDQKKFFHTLAVDIKNLHHLPLENVHIFYNFLPDGYGIGRAQIVDTQEEAQALIAKLGTANDLGLHYWDASNNDSYDETGKNVNDIRDKYWAARDEFHQYVLGGGGPSDDQVSEVIQKLSELLGQSNEPKPDDNALTGLPELDTTIDRILSSVFGPDYQKRLEEVGGSDWKTKEGVFAKAFGDDWQERYQAGLLKDVSANGNPILKLMGLDTRGNGSKPASTGGAGDTDQSHGTFRLQV